MREPGSLLPTLDRTETFTRGKECFRGRVVGTWDSTWISK
jgi:hypothetical protein